MAKKSDPQAGDLYLIRDLRIEQSVQGVSLKYEKFTSLLFSSSPPKPGGVFSYSVGKYTCQLLFLRCIYIYIYKPKEDVQVRGHGPRGFSLLCIHIAPFQEVAQVHGRIPGSRTVICRVLET